MRSLNQIGKVVKVAFCVICKKFPVQKEVAVANFLGEANILRADNVNRSSLAENYVFVFFCNKLLSRK